MNSLAIILSGLPASGKTTLGKLISDEYDLPLLDKDDFLERLFENYGRENLVSRNTLSRESDVQFQKEAMTHDTVVLVSHWRPLNVISKSGTPTEWLLQTYNQIIEIYCNVSVDIAADRFYTRKRHDYHGDIEEFSEIRSWLSNYESWFPLDIGKLCKVNTASEIDRSIFKEEIENIVASDV